MFVCVCEQPNNKMISKLQSNSQQTYATQLKNENYSLGPAHNDFTDLSNS